MTNSRKKSIADLIAKKTLPPKPSSAEIDQITSKIHQQAKTNPVQEKTKRISVNAPVSLYLKARNKATLQDQTLMAYIICLLEEDVKKAQTLI